MTNEISVLELLCDLEVWRLGFNPSSEQRVQKSAVGAGGCFGCVTVFSPSSRARCIAGEGGGGGFFFSAGSYVLISIWIVHVCDDFQGT
jgi:hypothetical protein